MALIIKRVNALPEFLVPETIYLVKTGNELTLTVTGNTGNVVATTVSKADVDSAISNAIGALNMSNVVQFAADITARNALTLTKSTFVYVADATADATVAAGAAMYLYDSATTTWHKVTEYESLDIVLNWNSISGKPSSSVADIEDAVNKRHSHSNTAVLDLLTAPSGQLLYNGAPVGGVTTDDNEW